MNNISFKILPFRPFRSEAAEKQQHTAILAQKIIQATRTSWFSKDQSYEPLKKQLRSIAPEQLKKVLETVSKEEEGLEALKGLSQILSAKRLEECLGIGGLEAAKKLTREARDYLEKTKNELSPSISTRLSAMLDVIVSAFENVIEAFGISEFFRPAENRSDARFKSQLIVSLLQFFTLVTAIALPLFGADQAGLIIGSILISISLLSLIYPSIRRAPSSLPNAENWTMQYRLGNMTPGRGRKSTLDEIARTLTASSSIKTHPLLIGKSGVGKTETARAFVEAIERGDYPELKGKLVFYIDTADLFNKSEGTKILRRFSEAMGRHRNNIILIFDQIHLVCQRKDSSLLGDQLKTFLDQGKENFPHVIGITTEDDFYQHIYSNSPTFARRFKKIPIDDTEPAETAQILKSALLKQSPKTLFEPNAFNTLIAKTKSAFGPETVEPASSLKILSLCIKKITETQKSSLEKKVEKLRSELDCSQTREELDRLETQLQREKENTEQLDRDLDQLADVKEFLHNTALKMSCFREDALPTEEKNKFLLLNQIFVPAREAKIKKEAKKLGVNAVIDSALIDQVIEEEKETIRKAHQIAKRLK